jgi:phosphocarrier protein HPr
MPEQQVTLTNEVGLHARPAAVFSKAAAGYSCTVTIAKGAHEANAKSILAVLKIDATQGDVITIRTEGDGADEALNELVKLISQL